MLTLLRLRLRIAAGRAYAAAFHAGGTLLRSFIKPQSPLGRFKESIAVRWRPRGKKKVSLLYSAFAHAYPEARFVQIGANDGVMDDPLREFVLRHRWRGVLVEPVPYLFEKLKANYPARQGLEFANVAIAPRPGQQPFYFLPDTLDDPRVPSWYRGLGSFSKEVLMKHADVVPGLEQRLQVAAVDCVTFDQLCESHGLARFDLLHIDTEGYDWEILKTVNFARYRPRLLVYERHHLNPADRAACREHLRQHGYEALEEGLDAICVNVRDLDARDQPVLAAWRLLLSEAEVPA